MRIGLELACGARPKDKTKRLGNLFQLHCIGFDFCRLSTAILDAFDMGNVSSESLGVR